MLALTLVSMVLICPHMPVHEHLPDNIVSARSSTVVSDKRTARRYCGRQTMQGNISSQKSCLERPAKRFLKVKEKRQHVKLKGKESGS